MKLTPLDIKKQQFKKVLRGYDPVEVDTFMDLVTREFEDLLKQQKELRDKLLETETQLKDYRQIEKTLQQTLLQAQEASTKTYETARREAEVIMIEAEGKAARIVQQATADITRMSAELTQLRSRKDALIGRLRVLLSSELDLLKTMELGGDPILDQAMNGESDADAPLEDILRTMDEERTEKTD